MGKQISDVVVLRLPLYLRVLSFLEGRGYKVVSSEELGKRLGLTAAQVRKDLHLFGKFGKQGEGYPIKLLKEKLSQILKADREWKVVVVGVGGIGRAILSAKRLPKSGFKIISAFDKNEVVGKTIEGIEVRSIDELEEVIKRERVKIAILALPAITPSEEVQEIIDRLKSCQIKAILNYSYSFAISSAPPEIKIRNMDPIAALQSLTYYLD